jgi:ubiquinone/menaquinone biosynthesis C-methylase UbiE
MTTDPNEQRDESRAGWEQVAAGWRSVQERINAIGMPVSRWMIDAIEPQPGMRILELAAGTGETGFLAAELIAPAGGTLISSDGAEAMLKAAEARAQELELPNVEFKQLELEWIDLPTAAVDAVLCRWGYMFAVDRAAAFRETRRVLRPGGRVALATWAGLEHNPWAALRLEALQAEDHPLPQPPTPFDLGSEDMLRELLEDAGFAEIVTAPVAVEYVHDDVDEYWSTTLALSRHFAQLVDTLDEQSTHALRARIDAAATPYATEDGTLRFPGRALVAAASA